MTTIITCPSCGAAYDIPALESIRGRKVRCRNCATVWRVDAPATATTDVTAGLAAQVATATSGSAAPARQADARSSDAVAARTVALPKFDLGRSDDQPVTIALGAARGLPPLQSNGHDASRAPARGTSPIAASAGPESAPSSPDRRRIGRRQSGFDEVEAAIAALQSSIEEPADRSEPTHQQRTDSSLPVVPAERAKTAPVRAPVQYGNPELNGYQPRADNPLEDDPFDDSDFERSARTSRILTGVSWVAFGAMLMGLGAFLYLERPVVVRALPGTARLYAMLGTPVNVRGLEFSGTGAQWQQDGQGRPILNLTGQVKNVTAHTQPVPTVVFAFQDADGRELFDWATPVGVSSLAAGESLPFNTIVPAPPDAVRAVEFRFARARR